ncbi:snapalysin [Streptomyces albiaxialis]|uniref:Extracellular small neutral protease n=1 Tax=Streptomyces albiaxialis TaxID=329523 RepID=A0ABN2VPS9_9ACTN
MRYRRAALPVTLGLGVAVTLGMGAAPASAQEAPAPSAPAMASTQGYTDAGESRKANEKFFKAVVQDALEKQAEKPGIQQVTVTYDARRAPTFRSQIANSTSIWNSSVRNVQLREGTNASFTYREGNDPRGSYAQTDMHGRGYIFLDYRQNQQYSSNRVVAHETGHVLGLYDNYRGPCSELMSGGGPGPSCTNDRPNATERARVDQLWQNGVASVAFDKVAFGK